MVTGTSAATGGAGLSARRLRASPGAALALGAVALLAMAAEVPLATLAHHFAAALPIVCASLPSAVVGCIVAYRQPRNPVGWLLLALGICPLVGLDAIAYSVMRYQQGHTGLPLGEVAVFVTPVEWVSVLLLLPLPLLLFPDGQLSGGWRWVLRCYLAVAGIWLIGLVALDVDGLVRPLNVDASGSFAVVDNPTVGWQNFATNDFVTIVYVVLAIAAVSRQLLAFRGSTGERRQQLKWLLGGGSICFLGLFAALATGGSPTGAAAVVSAAGLIAISALPAGIGIGILKYRLYDIDRIISRTISYTIVTGLLVGLFAGLVLLATRALPFSSPVGIAAATLAAAASFNPLRRRVQRRVDRRFNRARYDAESILTAFTARLREAVEIEVVRAELLHAVRSAVEPSHASVWVRPSAASPPRPG